MIKKCKIYLRLLIIKNNKNNNKNINKKTTIKKIKY